MFAQCEIPRVPAHIRFVDREITPQRARMLINHLASTGDIIPPSPCPIRGHPLQALPNQGAPASRLMYL
jgi:hypothetical protein